MIDLLKELCRTWGPSGNEGRIRNAISKRIEPYVDDLKTDVLGNLIATFKSPCPPGRDRAKSVMLSAHMDEIGIVITHIDENGFLRFAPVGGMKEHFLPGKRVRFESGAIGVIGSEPVDDCKDLKAAKMFVDACLDLEFKREGIGLSGYEIKVGYAACLDAPVFCTPDGLRMVAKSLDNRAGCAVLIEVARALNETRTRAETGGARGEGGDLRLPEVYFVFTAQGELGFRGGKTSAFQLAPDAALIVDVSRTGDTPSARFPEVRLGKGPAVKVKDSSFVSSPTVRESLFDAAKCAGIPCQTQVQLFNGDMSERGAADAAGIQLTREGIPTGVLSIPARYVHTPSEMVDTKDLEHCVQLIVEWLKLGVRTN